MKINIKINGTIPKSADIKKRLQIGLDAAGSTVAGKAIKNVYATPPKSGGVRTGNLGKRIVHTVQTNRVIVGVQSSTSTPYGKIQEYGGTILPKKGKWLTFKINGKWVRVPKVVIPAKKYLTNAFRTEKGKVKGIFLKILGG